MLAQLSSAVHSHLFPSDVSGVLKPNKSSSSRKHAAAKSKEFPLGLCKAFVDLHVAREFREGEKSGPEILRTLCAVAAAVVGRCCEAKVEGEDFFFE